jgi:hypothetical protein
MGMGNSKILILSSYILGRAWTGLAGDFLRDKARAVLLKA